MRIAIVIGWAGALFVLYLLIPDLTGMLWTEMCRH
jgi:hypothetical protein